MRQGLDKDLVLIAAGELADQIGYEKVSLASLAAKLQIRTPSLYNHISGLPGLKKELACYAIRKLKEKLAESAIGKSGREAILSIGEAYVSFVRRHPGLYEATMGAPDFRDPEVEAAGNEIVALIFRVLEPFYLSELNAIHAVRGLRSIVHGFASLELKKGFNREVSTDETLAVILNTYITGLRLNAEA
ncbi:WHG domain-containing protein [Aneurinibacillus sp. Ricciae_BoGa-3]|uniref:TetR/AcrR family transcriptional regulator n=1 Tax=Aneurinibacillus sp. Ricciae_BoGa-3 TaxID=3022697 RepID=UPI0023428397|nr:TetR/AcrR family transcriptional regulator [Aneurinibacillus sp. Ricciae_BoGa-3]WCK56615.1 WHG domain-containing protein [Aneurinibacillus sp. Ricciae_BoGa-3]